MKTKKRITAQERDLIALWKAEGLSNKECARRLNRHPSVIGRELKRNSFRASDGTKYYIAIHAQARAKEREQRLAHAKPELKNPDVYAYVTEHLRMGWSPDSIAGRLKHDFPTDRHWWITAETIYRWIYQREQLKEGWYENTSGENKRKGGNRKGEKSTEQLSQTASLFVSDQRRSIKEKSLAIGKEILLKGKDTGVVFTLKRNGFLENMSAVRFLSLTAKKRLKYKRKSLLRWQKQPGSRLLWITAEKTTYTLD